MSELSIADNGEYKIEFTNAQGEQVVRQSPSLKSIQKIFVSEAANSKETATHEFMQMFGDAENPVQNQIRKAYWGEFFTP